MIVLVWSLVTHLAGIYLFTRGFLLTRLSLPNISLPSPHFNSTLLNSHSRAILVLIDSLRFDFIAPHPPSPPNPYHHNVLTLPRDLTATRPRYSFIFNAYSDPPTTTLQRIKGITTGSLPTFVDIGSNFGASQVAEDSLLKQLSLQRKRLAFMGDDTWLSVFPSTFSQNLTFPFDSFNVEDLHTVDNGIVSHLFPLLSSPSINQKHTHSPPFDFLIAHFLGVDHIGHRLGPDNPTMRSKLHSLNSILKNTIDKLPPQTLLIVLGDHGMDSSGDHGGDGVLETSSGLWIYSKDFPLFNSTRRLPSELLEYRTFPGSTVKSRAIEQIDLVPSLALLLGLPIPYNNLGTVIPELFWLDRQGKHLEHALTLNAEQIMTFLRTYRSSPLGSELDDFWDSLESSYNHATQNSSSLTQEQKLIALLTFTRSALKACRSIWAQFNPTLMCFGLLVLSASLIASYSLYTNYASERQRDKWLTSLFIRAGLYSLLGSVLTLVVYTLVRLSPLPIPFLSGVTLPHFLIFSTSVSFSLVIIFLSPPSLPFVNFPSLATITSLLPLLHSLSFLSNSFTFWEDHSLPFLLLTSLLPYFFRSLQPSVPRKLRTRILTHLLVLTLCTRLMAISTVCREEQQPYCHVTFFASRSVPEPPRVVLYLILPIAMMLPNLIRRWFVDRTMEGHRQHWTIKVFFDWVLRPSLVGGTLFWIVEWIDSAGFLAGMNFNDSSSGVNEWTRLLRRTRTRIAWGAIAWLVLAGGVCWLVCPTSNSKIEPSSKAQTNEEDEYIPHQDNHLAIRFLILWSILFGIVWVCTQLTGQAVLALGTIALLSYLEVVSCVRVAEGLINRQSLSSTTTSDYPIDSSSSENPGLRDNRTQSLTYPTPSPTPLALLTLLTFYSTGHQASFSSIQWKAGFVLTENVHLPSSSSSPLSNPFFSSISSLSSIWGLSWLAGVLEKAMTVNLSYPLSGLTVVLNTVGGVVVWGGLGAGLVGCWRVGKHASLRVGTDDHDGVDDADINGHHPPEKPTTATEDPSKANNEDKSSSASRTLTELCNLTPTQSTLLTTLSTQTYFLLLLLGSSIGAAILRRHLMVWKVFAPRFMVGVLELVVLDVGGVVGGLAIGLGKFGRRKRRR